MNKVQAESAIPRPRNPFPIDRISIAETHLRGLSIILQYALDGADADFDGFGGPSMEHVSACFSLIGRLCDEVRQGVDELVDENIAARRAA